MKLTRIELTSFRSYRGQVIDLNAPRILIAGLNGSGKSSIRDAIQWTLTGRCHGTDGKGAGADVLVPTGASGADVRLSVDGIGIAMRKYSERSGGVFSVDTFTGTSQIQQQALYIKLDTTQAFLDAVLDTSVFLDLNHADAKALVLSLLDVRIQVGDQTVTLDELDRSYKEAFETRKVANRQLKAFGMPVKPTAVGMPAVETIEAQLGKLRTALGVLREAVGTSVGTRQALNAEFARLTDTIAAPVPDDVSEQIQQAEARIKELERTPSTQIAGPAPKKGDPARLAFLEDRAEALKAHVPANGCVLLQGIPCLTPQDAFSDHRNALLDEAKGLTPAAPVASQPSTESQLQAVRRDLLSFQQHQARREANFATVKSANQRQQAIRQELDALPDTAAQESDINTMQGRIAKGEQLLKDARAHWQALEVYEKGQERQQALAADVERLEALVKLLGANGARVPALAEALGTFEAAVNPYVKPFGWELTFTVEPWQAFANGRPVETYSRSERYRIGIALQLGIAQLSGLNFAIVDEIDMLDVANRALLSTMLMTAPLEQIIILGTRESSQPLKARAGLIAYRLENQNGTSVVAEHVA